MAFGMAEQAKLAVTLDLKGNFTQKLSGAARALQGFDRSTSRTQQSLSKFGRNIERGIALGVTAAVGGFVAVTKAAGDFEAQMNTIATIVDRSEIKGIGDTLRKTARDTGLALDDLTTAYYDLASAGIKGQLATEALNDAVKLGIGGLATTAETVDLLTTAINAYHLDAKGAALATDQFAQAVADGKVKASEIAATFANVASIAKTYKIGIDQIAASYAFLTAQGVPAAEVTTEMQRVIVSLAKPLPALEAAQKRLKIVFTEEVAKKGLVPALQELRLYADKNKIPLIELLGRIEAVKYVLQTTGPNFTGFNTEMGRMGDVAGVAAAQMAERQQGLNFQLARLKALAKDAGITIGTALLPKLTPLVEKLNAFISANQGRIAKFGTDLASGFTKLADALGKVDWGPFIDGLKVSADIAKSAVSLFRSLPEGLQAAVIAGFAVNKITGGLPTSIVKDVGGALINRFAERGSSPANPLWVASVGGVGGGLPGAGGGGIGKLVIPVAIAAIAIEAAKTLTDAIDPSLQAAIDDPTGAHGTPLGQRDPRRFNRNGQVIQNVLPPSGTKTNPIFVTPGGFTSTFGSLITAGGFDTRITGGGAGTRTKDDRVDLKQFARAISAEFQLAVRGLKTATRPKDVAKAVADALAVVIGQRRGNALATSRVLADLKGQLVHTTDPETRKILKAAIAQVEHKLVGRALVQKQLDKAEKIAKSSESTKDKIRDLTTIQKGFAHTSKSAAEKVQTKIDLLKAEEKRTTQAVKDKDLAVTIPITANITTGGFDIRNVINGATTIRRYGNETTSISTKFTNIRPPS